MKKLLILLLSTWSFFMYAQDSLTQVDIHGALQVKGTKITGLAHGNPVQLRGMSMFWSQWANGSKYYKEFVVNQLVDDWKVNIIRASMGVGVAEGGYLTNPEVEKQKVISVVDACIAKGIYVIIDWHSHTAQDEEAEAKAFFAEMAQKYGNYPNVIYEVFNEPLNVSWSGVIKPYCEAVIDTIRKYDPDNLVICGTRTWSQRVDEVAADRIEDVNVAYTLHYYAASHTQSLRNIAQTAINQGVPIFVTEFGTCEASGAGKIDFDESNKWWDFLEANDISWCNWSISDKDEAASALTPKSSNFQLWSDKNYTVSGAFVRDKLRFTYVAPVYKNTMKVEVQPGYELLYSDVNYQFDIKLFNQDTLVNKDSVKYYMYANNGGKIDNNGLFVPNGKTGSFRLFIEAVYDTLRTTHHVDFSVTDLHPSELSNEGAKTYLALTANDNYKLNTKVVYPATTAHLVPNVGDAVMIGTTEYVWKSVTEADTAFSVADSTVKSYLAIYVTNPVARTAKISTKQVGTSIMYINGIQVTTGQFSLLKGQNVVIIEYKGALDSSYFDFTIMDVSGEKLPFLSYTTISDGVYDCNKKWRGTAFMADCGCIGGNTGVAHCPGPYNGVAANIPGIIQSQEYDFGKAGVTYFDKSDGNNGDYNDRLPESVDISATADMGGVASIGWIEPGEWLKYTVNVTESGHYVVDFRVASALDNGGLQLKIAGMKLFAKDQVIQSTSGWSTWKTVTSDTIHLIEGEQELVFESTAGAFNINFMEFKRARSLGLNDALLTNVEIFPNPFETNLTVDVSSATDYQLFDVQGNLKEEGQCASSCKLGASLPKGVYILELQQGEKRKVQRLIKQ